MTRLTPRERQVMEWVRRGKSNGEVGQIIGCVEQTVKKHMQNIFRKLGVGNRISAMNELRS